MSLEKFYQYKNVIIDKQIIKLKKMSLFKFLGLQKIAQNYHMKYKYSLNSILLNYSQKTLIGNRILFYVVTIYRITNANIFSLRLYFPELNINVFIDIKMNILK